MKYIDAEKLKKAIEDMGLDCSFALKIERLYTLALIDELQQEQPMPDSTKLIELWHEDKEMLKEKDFRDDPWRLAYNAFMCGFGRGIAVNKQEQPENVVVVAKAFLDALSKTPYNNKPITDAQIIVRQLLLFFENPKEYNPDAILEQPEVDLEKEIDKEWAKCEPIDEGMGLESANIVNEQFNSIARHFYQLGLNTRK